MPVYYTDRNTSTKGYRSPLRRSKGLFGFFIDYIKGYGPENSKKTEIDAICKPKARWKVTKTQNTH